MPRKLGDVAKSILVNAPLPLQTKTYTVVSHQFIIDTIQQALKASGFEIEEETYRCTEDAQIASGKFVITYGDDPDLKMLYAFTNSYNKKVKFKSSIGAYVVENGASMISRIDHLIRKHTGVAKTEIETSIVAHIANASEYFDQLKDHKEKMSLIEIDKTQFGGLIGELYIHGFINTDQISAISKEYAKPVYTYTTGPNNLWTCYNHVISALRDTHPKKWLTNQVEVHTMFTLKYNLEVFDEDETSNEIQSDLTETSQENTEVIPPYAMESDEEYQARVAKIEGEPEVNLDAEEDADWEKHGMKEIKRVDPPAETEPIEIPDMVVHTEKLTATEVLEKHGDSLTEEQVGTIQEKILQDEASIDEDPFKPDHELNLGMNKAEANDPGQFILPGFERKDPEPIFKEEPVILGAESPEEEAQVKEALADAGISPAPKVVANETFVEAGPEILNDSDGLNPEVVEEMVHLAPSYNEDLGEDSVEVDEIDVQDIEAAAEKHDQITETYPPEWDEKPAAAASSEAVENIFIAPEEGKGIGDYMEIETVMYKIIDFPEVEGELYMELEAVKATLETSEPRKVGELVIIEAEDVQILPDVPEKKEEVPVKHEEQVDVLKNVVVPIVETKATFDLDTPVVVPEEATTETPEHKAIATELDDLYGYIPKFTFTKEGSQYNIVLETGESIVLSEALVNANN